MTQAETDITITGERGCGQRKKGGVYLTVPESPFGSPLENFLIDPPIVVSLAELGIGTRGVHLIERNGVTHVFDVVGRKHYPNVADFIEEARLLGISRRAELPDYSRLTPQSRLVLIHERAHLQNWAELHVAMSEPESQAFNCPSHIPAIYEEHRQQKAMCAGLWWHDVEQMQSEPDGQKGCRVQGVRTLPCGGTYTGWRAACNFFPEYHHAIFASFPIGAIEVVEDPDDRQHERKMDLANRSALPVSLVEA